MDSKKAAMPSLGHGLLLERRRNRFLFWLLGTNERHVFQRTTSGVCEGQVLIHSVRLLRYPFQNELKGSASQ